MPLDANATETLDLLVPGMKCGGCMSSVEAALGALPGVADVRANLTTKRVRVTLKANAAPETEASRTLIETLDKAGFEARPFDQTMRKAAETDAVGRDLLLRLGVAGFASMNVMLLSVSVWSGAEAATRDLMHWISALIALPAIVYAGMPFFRSALGALRGRRLNMDVPISLAITLSALSSVISTAQGGAHAYFDAGVMLLFFLLIGRYLDHRTRARARSAAAQLSAMTSHRVTRLLEDGSREVIATEALQPGMTIEIAAGERVQADGIVLSGRSDLDRALVTGESTPEPVAPGDRVNAGMTNLSAPLTVSVTATGDATLLAEIARMVDTAERARTRYDRLADRAARIYAPGVHVTAALGFAAWLWISGDWQVALGICTAILIITCPCALALAVPTVHTVATGRLFRSGLFLKDGAELERLAEVDLIAFDKTGTLTEGTPTLTESPAPEDPCWPVAAALAAASRHPFSQAIAERAKAQGIAPAELTDISEVPGSGIEALHRGHPVRLGRPAWVGGGQGDDGVLLDCGPSDGSSSDDSRRVAFRFTDALRHDAAETVGWLKRQGFDVALLSGDHRNAVREAAEGAGIDTWQARMTPQEKLAQLEAWQKAGRKVLMVGDGINDSPALSAAHASISPASASDVSKTAAGLIFTGKELGAVRTAISAARTARRRSLQSFGIAAVYNALAIPLAVCGYVTPLIAALAMSGSSILVVLNALRQGEGR